MGFRTLDRSDDIISMISLETTLEFENDAAFIQELWLEVYQKVVVDKVTYPFPIMICAATGKAESFSFWKPLKAYEKWYVTTQKEFDHDAYLSLYYLRLILYIGKEPIDQQRMRSFLNIYYHHLEKIYEFCGIREVTGADELEKGYIIAY